MREKLERLGERERGQLKGYKVEIERRKIKEMREREGRLGVRDIEHKRRMQAMERRGREEREARHNS